MEPNPNAKYGHSCDYVLGDFTESSSGYRFLADANLKNVGNVGLQVKATAVWFLAGGGSIKQSKTVNVPLGGEKRVGFMEVASQDEIDRHQALGFSQKTCTVKAAIVDTFGEPQG